MFVANIVLQIIGVVLCTCANAEFYEDRRCSCVCPTLDLGVNNSKRGRLFYQDNTISPEECNCRDMVLPRIENKFNGSLLTYCMHCDCHYETRNTTLVLIVIVSLMAIISVLIVYMSCLHVLQKIIHRRRLVNRRIIGNEEQQSTSLLNNNNQHLDSSDDY